MNQRTNDHKQSKNADYLVPPRHIFNEKSKIFNFAIGDNRFIIKAFKEHESSSLSEKEFYELFDQLETNEEDYGNEIGVGTRKVKKQYLLLWLPFLPKYFGNDRQIMAKLDNLDIANKIVIENVLHDIEGVCLMDLKIGRINKIVDLDLLSKSIDNDSVPYANLETIKDRRLQQGFTLDGFLLCPRKDRDSSLEKYNEELMIRKFESRQKSFKGIIKKFTLFIRNAGRNWKLLIDSIISQLEGLRAVFYHSENVFRLFSASLLVVYDSLAENQENLKAKVNLIDFEHVLTVDDLEKIKSDNLTLNASQRDVINQQSGDQNLVYGVESLISIFTAIGEELSNQLKD